MGDARAERDRVGGAAADGGGDAAPGCEEGETRPCPEPTCPDGEQTCAGGQWGPCQGTDEICDGADNDCDTGIDGTPAAPNQCAGFSGAYGGSYSHSAVEKLGATIINQMHCTGGSSSLTVDLSANPVVQGTVTCTYSGGLVAFDNTQTGEISATLDLDGNVSGTLVHYYESQLTKTYSFDGTLSGGNLEIIDEGDANVDMQQYARRLWRKRADKMGLEVDN